MKIAKGARDLNRRKYAQAPSWEQILEFINEMGMDMYHFEKFYSIPYNTITQVKAGKRMLPSHYWAIIYEKIRPAYGSGFLEDYLNNTPKNRIKRNLTTNLTEQNTELPENHDRIVTLK